MPTDLEVPFRAVEGVRREIVESLDCTYDGDGAVHLRLKVDAVPARDLFPLLEKTGFVEKYNGEVLDYMFFHVAFLEAGTSPKR
mgnify:CR=1 FL=1